VALSFHYRELRPAGEPPARVALLPGAWNPPTVAHVAMAQAALSWADEVVLILPRVLPHKEFEGITAQDRVALLAAVAAARRFSAATAEGGLYVEMADEAAAYFGADTEIGLVCGRDAAERIAAWDYGRPGIFDEMIARYPLLVSGGATAHWPGNPFASGGFLPRGVFHRHPAKDCRRSRMAKPGSGRDRRPVGTAVSTRRQIKNVAEAVQICDNDLQNNV